MDETFESKIKQLKAELQVAQQANQLWNILIEKREILESKVAKLTREIDNNRNIVFRMTSKDVCAKKVIESKEEILKKIKSSKQEIDEKLDDLEGISEEMIEYLKNQLILAILQKHPDQETEFKKLDLKCAKNERLANELRILTEFINGIVELIKNIIKETQQPKYFRLINFFFGRSHYLVIQKYLQNLQMMCGKTLDLLRDTQELTEANDNISNQLEELSETIIQLQLFSLNRWSIKKVDQNLIPLSGIINLQLKNWMHSQQLVEEKIAKGQNKIDQWIDKFS